MIRRNYGGLATGIVVLLGLTCLSISPASAAISGVTGSSFNLTAAEAQIVTGEGNTLLVWGYTTDSGAGAQAQYPGPTLIVNQGTAVTVTLTNNLSVPVSIVFPGQPAATATGGVAGLIAREAPPGGSVQYQFTASNPGTFMYYSGTNTELQAEMGLFGALIVRPAESNQAYSDPYTAFGHEYLFLLSEMDATIHDQVQFGQMNKIDNTKAHTVYWFINGRNGPDTLQGDNDPLLPRQPYGALARQHPGDKTLIRFIGAGRELHPLHTHGNNFMLIARNGRLLSTNGSAADLGVSDFTQTVVPGETYDGLWTWNGRELGWDYYGHSLDAKACSGDGVTPCTQDLDCSTVPPMPGGTCSVSDPAQFPAATEMISTTLAGGLGSGAGVGTQVSFTDTATCSGDGVTACTDDRDCAPLNAGPGGICEHLPMTHSFRVLVWDSAIATPNEDSARDELTVAWDIVDSRFEIVAGTTTSARVAGAHIAMTDHGRDFSAQNPNMPALPVALPDQKDLTLGAMWSGSPFLGAMGALPPGEGGFNVNGGFFFIWHSHTEKELTNFNIFPGGMLSFMLVEPHGVPIP